MVSLASRQGRIWPTRYTLFAVLLILSCFLIFYCTPTRTGGLRGGEVLGIVAWQVPGENQPDFSKYIYLPDAEVVLKNDTGGIAGGPVVTGFDGRFTFPRVEPGVYEVCASAPGFNDNCISVTVDNSSFYVSPPLTLEAKQNAVYGKCRLADGSVPFLQDEVFQAFFHTEVYLTNASGEFARRKANFMGEYVIPEVPTGTFQGIAEVEAGNKGETVVVNGTTRRDYIFTNTSPSANSLTAYRSGAATNIVSPGVTVDLEVKAEDAENDPMTFRWSASGNTQGYVSSNSDQITWTMPSAPATYTMYVLIVDGKGGHSRIPREIRVRTDNKVLISGIVRDQNRLPVAGAEVRIFSAGVPTTTQTNGAGFFGEMVDDSRRISVNIDKPGFSLISRVVYGESINEQYTLWQGTEIKNLPPGGGDITLEEELQSRDREFREPAQVIVNPDDLVQPGGGPPVGNIDATLRGYGVVNADDPIPGDYAANNANNQSVRLESFGAIDATFRDGSGATLDLQPGRKARIRIPVDSRLLNPPNYIDLWSYVEEDGTWNFEGTAAINPTGKFYEAEVTHFSAYNADVQFTDAACMQLLHNPIAGVAPPFDVKVIIPTSGGTSKTVTINNLNSFPSVVTRMPVDSVVTVETYKNGSLINTQTVFLSTNNPGTAQANPSPPYDFCKNRAYIPGPNYPATPSFDFLARITNNEAKAWEYYELIGAINGTDTITFSEWKTAMGFDCTNDTAAIYYNAGDLGFWRGMHYMEISGPTCSSPDPGNFAYYVSNYRSDVDANNDANVIATVGMEFSPLPGGGDAVTKFFVWNGAGKLVQKADLDGNGEKFIPGLCVVCHGGTLTELNAGTPGANLESKFIPFDIYTFEFSGISGLDSASQQQDFYRLNRGVYKVADSLGRVTSLGSQQVGAIKDYVSGMYNNFSPSATFRPDSTYLPSNGTFSTKQDLYLNVVAPGCRSCHIQRTSSNIHFDDRTDFGNNLYALCSGSNPGYMPNAKLTFAKFWMGHHDSPCELKTEYGNIAFPCASAGCP